MNKDEIFEKEATYVSPITVKLRKFQRELDNFILNEIREYDVKVDKEELIKALKYDRNQYEKGYADGKKEAAREILQEVYDTFAKKVENGLPNRLYDDFTSQVVKIIANRHGIELEENQ